MKIINKICIDTFKGIESLELDKCGDVNLIVGDNNTCKTTVLEAIQFLQYPNDFREMIRISRKRDIASRRPRDITVLESFLNIFNATQSDENKEVSLKFISKDIMNTLKITGEVKEVYITENEINEISKYKRGIMFEHEEEIPVKEFRGIVEYNSNSVEVFINELTDIYRYGDMSLNKKEKVVQMSYLTSIDHMNERFSTGIISDAIFNNKKSGLLDLLRLFDENIEGLEILSKTNSLRATPYIKHKKFGYMPVSSFGDGLKKVLALASSILSISNGVLLIDEIETAIHTSALNDVFRWLLEAARRRNIQIFATTHSEEALSKFLLNNQDYGLEISVYRLENNSGHIIARRFSEKKAKRIIIENGGDLR